MCFAHAIGHTEWHLAAMLKSCSSAEEPYDSPPYPTSHTHPTPTRFSTAEGLYKRREFTMSTKKLYDSWPEGHSRAQLLDRVLVQLPPRMHRWFLAKFPGPATWLQVRAIVHMYWSAAREDHEREVSG
eukprot:365371-Chlamydomonas_euryale.AAC.3